MSLGDDHKEALGKLQTELEALKHQHGARLRMRKAAGDGSSRSFLVSLRLDVPAPAAADSYDCDSLQVCVQLTAALLTSAGDDAGLSLEIRNAELPSRLRHCIAQRLLEVHRAQRDGGGFGLASIFDAAAANFVSLLCSLPELVEAYQSTDTAGATVRRYAIINDDQTVIVDASVTVPHSQPGEQPQAIKPGQQQRQPRFTAAASDVGPPALQAELTWLQRRYGAAFQLQPPAEAAADRRQQRFTLRLVPTDPSWERGQLRLDASIADSYPRSGAITITSATSCPEGAGASNHSKSGDILSPGTAEALAKLLTAEAAGTRGPMRLRALVRSLENTASQHVQQAEDLAVEVAVRRKAATGAASSVTTEKAASLLHQPHGSRTGRQAAARTAAASHAAAQQVGTAASQAALPGGRQSSFGRGLWWPGSAQQPLEQAAAGLHLHSDGVDKLQDRSLSGSGGSRDSSDDSSSGYSSGCGSDTGGSDHSGGATSGGGHSGGDGARSAIALELLDLVADGVDAIEPHDLTLQVTCGRCRRPGEVKLSAGEGGGRSRRSVAAASCSHCHHDWEVGLRGSFVHEHSSRLASLWPVGCAPVDLLPSVLVAQCAACSAVAALRQVQVGRPTERACSQCHATMRIRFSGVSFSSRTVPGSTAPRQQRDKMAAGGQHAAGGLAAQQVALVAGQPLPDLGACKHYRHSHRWLRFPCCGMRFPCDLCHEEGTDGHEMKWAARMVCGHCSVEQPVGPRCASCNKKLASSANKSLSGRPTRFWEGGQGCRDPKRLDRRDAHKHRGSKLKTGSKKATRVGQEGKQRRQRGQWRAED